MIGDVVVPDAIESIRGFRAWGCARGRLLPLVNGYRYSDWGNPVNHQSLSYWGEPGWQSAQCLTHWEDHPAPGELCTCGFWALSSHELLLEQICVKPNGESLWDDRPPLWDWDAPIDDMTTTGVVTGEVELRGRIIVGKLGWRAQEARVTAIYERGYYPVAEIAESLGVPLVRLP